MPPVGGVEPEPGTRKIEREGGRRGDNGLAHGVVHDDRLILGRTEEREDDREYRRMGEPFEDSEGHDALPAIAVLRILTNCDQPVLDSSAKREAPRRVTNVR